MRVSYSQRSLIEAYNSSILDLTMKCENPEHLTQSVSKYGVLRKCFLATHVK